jgi:hypothetical protein
MPGSIISDADVAIAGVMRVTYVVIGGTLQPAEHLFSVLAAIGAHNLLLLYKLKVAPWHTTTSGSTSNTTRGSSYSLEGYFFGSCIPPRGAMLKISHQLSVDLFVLHRPIVIT